MEECLRYRERWFKMGLRGSVYHYYSLRDRKGKTPFLVFIENNIDLGNIPFHLPKLS
jgi:hypothetical protein